MPFDVPFQNYMLQDIFFTVLALVLLPLFMLAPGYVIGWAANILDFQHRRVITRLLLGNALSVAIVPAFTFLIARLAQIKTSWWIFIPVWGLFFWLIIPELSKLHFPRDRWVRLAIGLTLSWVLLAVFSLVDLQVGQGLYYSVIASDWTHRVAMTDAIVRTGIPPVNPFFFPGEPVKVSYYYFWSIYPALLTQLTGGILSARITFIASAIGCGIALRSVAALYLRFHSPEGSQDVGPRTAGVLGLLFLTGLDIIFIAIMLSYYPNFPGLAEGWNGSAGITSWNGATLWVPNHVASLIACLTSLILFQSVSTQTKTLNRFILLALVGICLASAVGMSIYVAFVFLVFWGLWFLISLLTRETRAKAAWLFLAGMFAFFFISPFLIDTLKNRDNSATVLNIFSFAVRPIFLIENNSLVQNAVPNQTLRELIHVLLLPANYFLELGFFMLAGLVYLQFSFKNTSSRKIISVDLLLLLTSVGICSFFESTIIQNNDLGWRGILPAQFILLIWSVNILSEIFAKLFRKANHPKKYKISSIVQGSLIFTLFIGLCSSLFDIFHLRFYYLMNDRQTWLTSQGGISSDTQIGFRNYSLRQAYQFIKENYPIKAIVQNNPNVFDIDFAQGLYGDHQTIVSGPGATTYGVTFSAYQNLRSQIQPIFEDASLSGESVNGICVEYAAAVLIVTDIDPIWKDPESWVWQEQPAFETPYVRLFNCR